MAVNPGIRHHLHEAGLACLAVLGVLAVETTGTTGVTTTGGKVVVREAGGTDVVLGTGGTVRGTEDTGVFEPEGGRETFVAVQRGGGVLGTDLAVLGTTLAGAVEEDVARVAESAFIRASAIQAAGIASAAFIILKEIPQRAAQTRRALIAFQAIIPARRAHIINKIISANAIAASHDLILIIISTCLAERLRALKARRPIHIEPRLAATAFI